MQRSFLRHACGFKSYKSSINTINKMMPGNQNNMPRKMLDTYDKQRYWKMYENCNNIQQKLRNQESKYKIVSYNILSPDLLNRHVYLYYDIPSQLLLWQTRLYNLSQEIKRLDPDILCLQELEPKHLPDLIKSISNGKRLEYIYKKKTGDCPDGCAIVYDKDKFKCVEDLVLEYHNDAYAVLNRENIAVCLKLQSRNEPDKELIVATTHLLYNPRREDVRSAQVNRLLNALCDFSKNGDDQPRTPVVLTGDFNFESNTLSYRILTKQQVDCSAKTNESIKLKSIDFGDDSASTFQDAWVTVDYLLHSVNGNQKNQIDVSRVYTLPRINQMTGPIPNNYLGSDHYCLAMLFSLI